MNAFNFLLMCQLGFFIVDPCISLLTEGDHIVESRSGEFQTSCFHGVVGNDVGGWGKEYRPTIEILGDNGLHFIIKAKINGKFKVNLQEGSYCIRISHFGWQPYISRLLVKKEFPRNKLNVSLKLGV